jgi:hypothetical protein
VQCWLERKVRERRLTSVTWLKDVEMGFFFLHMEDVQQVSNRQNPSKVGIKLTIQLFKCRFFHSERSITSPIHHVVLLFNAYLVFWRYKVKWLLHSGLESASRRLFVR